MAILRRSAQQKLLYEQRINTTLEHMQKKASRECSATLECSPNDVLNEEAQVRFYVKKVPASIFERDIQQMCGKID